MTGEGGSHGMPREGGSRGMPGSLGKGGSPMMPREGGSHNSESDTGIMFDVTRNLADGGTSDLTESEDESHQTSHSSQMEAESSSESTDGELRHNLDLRLRSRRGRRRPAYLEHYILESD